jgi:uncharacterized protein (TIGR03790 family)
MAALFSRSNPLCAFALLTNQKIAKGPAWQVALALLILCSCPERVMAGGSGLNTVVVLNQASQNSREIANRYCERRDVPPDQVLRISWSGDPDQWTSTEFETHLRTRLLNLVANLQISNQISFVVLAPDIPTRTLFNTTNYNSTTAALFYGLKTDLGTDPTATNLYAFSELSLPELLVTNNTAPQFLATALQATSVPNALRLIDQGVQSDGKFPPTARILAKTSDLNRNLRHLRFDNAILDSRVLAIAELTRTNADNVALSPNLLGFQTGLARFSVASNQFAPGAIADSMSSFGGILSAGNDQTNLLVFIDAGASGSYGTVAEPLSDVQKFPDPLVYYYQSRGFSVAESYYLSLRQPYLGLIVAEPLAAPFARNAGAKWQTGISNATLTGQTTLEVTYHARDSAHPVQKVDLFVDGKFSRTLTNLPPVAGNVITLFLNGYPVSYTVPTNATLATMALELTTRLNDSATTNATRVRAFARGDRIELQSCDDDSLPYPYFFQHQLTIPVGNVQYRVSYLPANTPPAFQSIGRDPLNRFHMSLALPTPRQYLLQASSDLEQWETILASTSSGSVDFVDAESKDLPQRFYRLVGPPANALPGIALQGLTADRKLLLQLSSITGQAAAIMASPDALNWNAIATNLPGGTFDLAYSLNPSSPQQFFRAMHLPAAPPQLNLTLPAVDSALVQVTAPVQPYVIEFSTNSSTWLPLVTNFSLKQIQASATVSIGTGIVQTTFARMAQPTFLPGQAQGFDSYQVLNFPNLNAGAWLRFTITKTNSQVVQLGVTNQTTGTSPALLVAQMVNAINAHPELQGPDGLTADDFLSNAVVATFNLRARSPGFAAAKIRAHAQKYGVNITPYNTARPLFSNRSDLQARNHLYLSAGLTELPLGFTLDTTQLSDGFHELTAVAYEGSHVRTQTRVSIPVCVSNSPLAATLNLGTLTNNASVLGDYSVQVTANTNNVSLITLHSTGGPIGFATNQSSATFSVIASNLWIGRHPFYATVETSSGQKFRTQTSWIRLQ